MDSRRAVDIEKVATMTAPGQLSQRSAYYALAVILAAALSACHGSQGALYPSSAAASSAATSASNSNPSIKAVTLSWTPPTQNSDGTPLTNLAGYELHYGTSSEDYTGTVPITNPATTSYVVSDSNFPSGTYYFAISAYNAEQVSSPLSSEVVVTVD